MTGASVPQCGGIFTDTATDGLCLPQSGIFTARIQAFLERPPHMTATTDADQYPHHPAMPDVLLSGGDLDVIRSFVLDTLNWSGRPARRAQAQVLSIVNRATYQVYWTGTPTPLTRQTLVERIDQLHRKLHNPDARVLVAMVAGYVTHYQPDPAPTATGEPVDRQVDRAGKDARHG